MVILIYPARSLVCESVLTIAKIHSLFSWALEIFFQMQNPVAWASGNDSGLNRSALQKEMV